MRDFLPQRPQVPQQSSESKRLWNRLQLALKETQQLQETLREEKAKSSILASELKHEIALGKHKDSRLKRYKEVVKQIVEEKNARIQDLEKQNLKAKIALEEKEYEIETLKKSTDWERLRNEELNEHFVAAQNDNDKILEENSVLKCHNAHLLEIAECQVEAVENFYDEFTEDLTTKIVTKVTEDIALKMPRRAGARFKESTREHVRNELRFAIVTLKEEARPMCVICLIEAANFVWTSCGHRCLCQECFEYINFAITRCPICRETAMSITEILSEEEDCNWLKIF